jgi:hypothetical protein
MSDPVRLLSSSRDGMTRALLESASAPGPTNDQCDELWSSLASRLPGAVVAGVAGGATGAAVAKAVTSKAIGAGLLLKGAVVVGVLGSIATVGLLHPWSARPVAAPREIPSASVPAPRPPVAPVVAPVAPPPVVDAPELPAPAPVAPSIPVASLPAPRALPARTAPPPPAASEPPTPVASEREIALHAESASLLRARQLLRSGDCAEALTQLKQGTTRFPNGALAQEREVLAIEALACAGRTNEARTRAEAFARDYPTSPHASKVQRFTR